VSLPFEANTNTLPMDGDPHDVFVSTLMQILTTTFSSVPLVALKDSQHAERQWSVFLLQSVEMFRSVILSMWLSQALGQSMKASINTIYSVSPLHIEGEILGSHAGKKGRSKSNLILQ